MIDIHKATRVQDKELRSQLDNLEFQELIRSGNLYEIRSKLPILKIDPKEFEALMRDQCADLHAQVFQDAEIKSMEAAYHAPDFTRFPVHHQGTMLPTEDMNSFNEAMAAHVESPRFKAMSNAKAQNDDRQLSPEELQQLGEGTLDEATQFMDETWFSILDAQMMQDYTSKMGQIQEEVRRMIALVKQGIAGPEFALIAMAKVNQTKNGVLFTWLGKKAFHVNDSINKIADDLKKGGAWDPGSLQVAQAKTRDGAFQLNLLMTDMQKVMQDSASVLEQVHSIMGEMNRTRREIITKVAAQ